MREGKPDGGEDNGRHRGQLGREAEGLPEGAGQPKE